MRYAGVSKPPSRETELECPFYGKPLCEVCHKCDFYEPIRGTNPNTGEEIDRWGCAIKHQFLVTMEVAKVTYEMGAAVESSRNEAVEYSRLDLRMQHRNDPEALQILNRQFQLMDAKNAAKLLNSHGARRPANTPRIQHVPDPDMSAEIGAAFAAETESETEDDKFIDVTPTKPSKRTRRKK